MIFHYQLFKSPLLLNYTVVNILFIFATPMPFYPTYHDYLLHFPFQLIERVEIKIEVIKLYCYNCSFNFSYLLFMSHSKFSKFRALHTIYLWHKVPTIEDKIFGMKSNQILSFHYCYYLTLLIPN